MPKKKSENRIKAKELYDLYHGDITNREIANRLGISEKSISAWKSMDNWNGNDLSTKKKSDLSTKKKRGGQPGNSNAKGKLAHNQNARTHGLFSKWLPEELKQIIEDVAMDDPLDILWNSIQVQMANIVYAQQILFVKDKEDITREITMLGEDVTAWDVQQAWDKQGNALKSQSRAMADLNRLVKTYYEILDRRKDTASDEQKARISLLEAQKNKLEMGNNTEPDETTQTRMDAISGILVQMEPVSDDEVMNDEPTDADPVTEV